MVWVVKRLFSSENVFFGFLGSGQLGFLVGIKTLLKNQTSETHFSFLCLPNSTKENNQPLAGAVLL
jgi:hypothetical protein